MNHIIFLCGGQGKRFQDVSPSRKPTQLIYSRYMYEWVLDSICSTSHTCTPQKLTLAIQNDPNGHSILYNVKRLYSHTYDISHSLIEYNTRGPIETCLLTLNQEHINGSFWVLDNDIIYDNNIDWNHSMNPDEIYILVQKIPKTDDISSPYGHVVIDCDTNLVTRIVEKENISDTIIIGGYGFGSAQLYKLLFNEFIYTAASEGEWFMSSLLDIGIKRGIKINPIYADQSVAIGTPAQLEEALMKRIIIPRQLRWVFDLDETLVTLPQVPGDYSSVLPITKTINFVNHLYDTGHYIIIHTARHMKTCNGNLDLVKEKVGQVTRETLSKYNIQYHELIFGKPYADIYVDDKSTNPHHWQDRWIKSSIGFGWDHYIEDYNIENNKIIHINNELCYKVAKQCEAEGNIYFYKNVPESIREFIPKIYNSEKLPDNRYKILMEWKYDAISIGKLIANNMMDTVIFYKVLQMLERLHKTSVIECVSNIEDHVMQNYYPKLLCRCIRHDTVYREFAVKLNYDELEKFFACYKPELTDIIHGDYWLSNLLWSHKEKKIYMIDMRGRLGDVLATQGDKRYDYAKLLQSLYGFDSLVNNQEVQCDLALYRRLFYEYFNMTDQEIEELKKITATLILGSLPFHEKLIRKKEKIYIILNELWPCLLTS